MSLVCKSCNHINLDIAVYCANCGAKLLIIKNKNEGNGSLKKETLKNNNQNINIYLYLFTIFIIFFLIVVIFLPKNQETRTKELPKISSSNHTNNKPHSINNFSLEVRATPSDSNISILELDKSYYKNMLLKEGDYTVTVSHDGYKTFSKKIILNHNSYVTAKLEKNILQKTNKKSIWKCKIKWIIDNGEKFKPTNKNLQTLSIELIDGADKLHLKTQNGESVYDYDSFIDLKDNNLGMNYTHGNRFIDIFENKTLFLGNNEKGIDTKYYCEDMILNIKKSTSSKNTKNISRDENKTIITPIEKFSLTINSTPLNAKIRILNIKPKYYDGIKLKEENYRIEISANGYKTMKKWIRLNSNSILNFKLKKITHIPIRNDHYIYRGVNKALSVYIFDKLGMVGMRDTVEDCYNKIDNNSNQNDIKKCFSMDISSNLLDYSMAKFSNFPQNDFFLPKNINIRLKSSFNKTKIKYDEWKNIINEDWTPKIIKQYEETLEKSFLDKKY